MGKVGYCCFQETLILSLQNPVLLGFLTWLFVILVELGIQSGALCVLPQVSTLKILIFFI